MNFIYYINKVEQVKQIFINFPIPPKRNHFTIQRSKPSIQKQLFDIKLNFHRASPSLALTRTPRIIPVPKSEPIKREKMSPYRVRTFKSKVNCVTSIEHSFDSYLRPLLTHHYVFHLRSQGRTLPPIYSSSQRGARWESC